MTANTTIDIFRVILNINVKQVKWIVVVFSRFKWIFWSELHQVVYDYSRRKHLFFLHPLPEQVRWLHPHVDIPADVLPSLLSSTVRAVSELQLKSFFFLNIEVEAKKITLLKNKGEQGSPVGWRHWPLIILDFQLIILTILY